MPLFNVDTFPLSEQVPTTTAQQLQWIEVRIGRDFAQAQACATPQFRSRGALTRNPRTKKGDHEFHIIPPGCRMNHPSHLRLPKLNQNSELHLSLETIVHDYAELYHVQRAQLELYRGKLVLGDIEGYREYGRLVISY